MSTTIPIPMEGVSANSLGILYHLSSCTNTITGCLNNVITSGGRVIKSGAPYVGSLVQTVVEKSPLGTVVTGLGLTCTGVAMARRELSFKRKYHNECSNSKMAGYVLLAAAGAGITTLGLLQIYGITVGSGNTPATSVSKGTLAPGAAKFTHVNASYVNAAPKTFTDAFVHNPVLSGPAVLADNRTIAAFVLDSAPVVDAKNLQSFFDAEVLGKTAPAGDIVAQSLPQVAKKVESVFDNRTMCSLLGDTSAPASINHAICELPRPEGVVRLELPLPEPGFFNGISWVLGWGRK